ncbi:acid-sensing ion channel 1A-like [Littorina saxatilis]|uniref:acid-sensing ion channel 1A-like n=1 Tax=Littorina saxatilis TaxID=31220 RepID=UPI0038B59997
MDGQSNAPEKRESVLGGQDNDKKEGGRSVGGLLKGFAEQTSMHGVARVAATDHHVVWRVLWLTLVLPAGGWAVYNVYQILTLFSTYPVSTVVSVQYQTKVDFPAVTLCNLNTLRRSQYLENADFLGLRSDLSNGEVNTIGGALDFEEEQFQLNKIKEFLRKLPPEELHLTGHQISDMLLMCDFAGIPCHSE